MATMKSRVGTIETVAVRDVWPKEPADFTPWLQSRIGQLDNVLGLGLSNPQREVGAGDFRIDLVAGTNFGDVVIENQFGKSDHRHLGQLVTYLSHREVQRAIWIVEDARPEHVKAVETLERSRRGADLDGHRANHQDWRFRTGPAVYGRRRTVRRRDDQREDGSGPHTGATSEP